MAASMATPGIHCAHNPKYQSRRLYAFSSSRIIRAEQLQPQPQPQPQNQQAGRREIVLRSSELAVLGAIFHFSGTKPNYLGIQKNPPSLALCPATNNCVSTSENTSDLTHYAPPWNYNPEEGRGSMNPVSREVAMQELLEVIKSTKPDNFTPRIVEQKDDYVRVEYESPIMGFVDDVEFWFPPGKKSLVQYRSASRLGNFDFDVNRKRIKALRLKLEKKGWASEVST
ncbi:uncharacterized protein [Coffea arabica]|uniref:DUF1499 domain-containing protein n=1 Tax=Coffea arabica TaxID=13443 RepID=A0A6P6W0M7_COFAR|nr:uncharacterized protein LOC113727714 [Coffea arabica]XP_027108136.1 uncharacterized protein LOC113727926 [Coffea arabica]